MYPNSDVLTSSDIASFTEEETFSLGLKELLFLAFILFIGFCGFTVCVDKIYSAPDTNQIQSITVHNKSASTELTFQRPKRGLSLN